MGNNLGKQMDDAKCVENAKLFPHGRVVEVVDKFNGSTRVVCTGNVERTTRTLVIIRNQHGNEGRYRLKDLKMVGYSWPHLTNEIRPKE